MQSVSEKNGLNFIPEDSLRIYSAGISTAGNAEIQMAKKFPRAHVVGTTIDEKGAQFVHDRVKNAGLSDQIEVKVEDVSSTLDYSSDYFDFIYARLVLHYLSSQKLDRALKELFRILKKEGRLFVVVRSGKEIRSADIDPFTQLTTYSDKGSTCQRYFHSVNSIRKHLAASSFNIEQVKEYEELLCSDFKREIISEKPDHLIEILAIK